MHVKVDEDLPVAIMSLLRQRGYLATSVLEQGMSGWKDPQLWDAVQIHGQFLVTADKGFGDIRAYAPSGHGGVLLLRPDQDGIRSVVELVRLVLDHSALEALVGMLTVATPRGIRIRRR